MNDLRCTRAGMWLAARRAGLSQADSLRLEEHLASCEHCRSDAEQLDALRAVADRVDGTLSMTARERAIRAALDEAPARIGSGGARGTRVWLRVGGAIAAAALVALALRSGLSSDTKAARVDRVLLGQVEVDGSLRAQGSELSTATLLHASTPARVALVHADVDLHAGTRLRWNRGTRVLRLESGSIVADVDPNAHQPFTVETPRFRVLVLGTRFAVSLDSVSVERGRVRVIDVAANGHEVVLGAGERFTASPAAPAGARASTEAQAPDRAHALDDVQANPATGRVQTEHAKPATKSATELLTEARAQLADHRVSGARHALEAALALALDRDQRAEALSLRAECALVDGDLGGAVEGYLRVSRTFAALEAGQNALFAAARIEADRGHSAAAAQLLERYLERYPNGHFVREARARVRELSAALDRAP